MRLHLNRLFTVLGLLLPLGMVCTTPAKAKVSG